MLAVNKKEDDNVQCNKPAQTAIRQPLITSFASPVSTRHCNETTVEKIGLLITKMVTGDGLHEVLWRGKAPES